MSFWTYLLRCADGSYYAGHAEELETRVSAHQLGEIEGYTQKRRPVALVWSQAFPSREEAIAAERQIKGWTRAKKEALIRGDWDGLQLFSRKLFLRYAGSTSSPATQDERNGRTGSSVLTSRSEREVSISKDLTKPPIIVLVRPQLGQNIGKAARAMLNFGLTEMRLVAPRDGWPNPDAGPSASGADIVLEQARVFDTVADAVADCSNIYASTVRRRDLVMPVLTPEQMANEIGAGAGPTAILFGPERSGLETEDVALSTAIVTVPINPEFGSLNLAQAVILLAYEWSKSVALAQPPAKELEPPAPHAELEGLICQLDEELNAKGYFFPPERAQATRNTIRTILTKPRWASPEVKAMRGIIRALVRPARIR
jgi:tRNA/rRNA methyltransferase